MQQVALQPLEQSGGPRAPVGGRVDESIGLIEVAGRAQRTDVLAPAAAPDEGREWVAHVHGLPEAITRAERVDDDVGDARNALEELAKTLFDLREAEDVHGARP